MKYEAFVIGSHADMYRGACPCYHRITVYETLATGRLGCDNRSQCSGILTDINHIARPQNSRRRT